MDSKVFFFENSNDFIKSDFYTKNQFIDNSIIIINNFTIVELNIVLKNNVDFYLVTKDSTVESEINVELVEPHISSTIKQIALTRKDESFDCSVSVIHKAKDTRCEYKFLGFAFDKSHLKIKAKNRILNGMKQSSTYQGLKILTDGDAKAIGQPGLMVEEFDVTAAHGNSIGQIDRRLIYYLQTKGISSKEAKWMTIQANVENNLDNCPSEIKESLIAIIRSYYE